MGASAGNSPKECAISPSVATKLLYFFAFACSLSCMSPIYFQYHFSKADDPLAVTLASPSAILLLCCTAVVSFPMFIDIILDFSSMSFFFAGRVIILVASTIVPLIYVYIIYHHSVTVAADWYICLGNCQTIWIALAVYQGILTSEASIWKPLYLIIMFSLSSLQLALSTFAEGDLHHGQIFKFLSLSCQLIAGIMFSRLFGKYIHYLYKLGNIPMSEQLPFLCILVIVLYLTVLVIIPSVYAIFYTRDTNFMSFVLLTFVTSLIAILCTILPGRVARFRFAEAQHLLDVKKNFIRYIGHELRTPINVASVGLNILLNDAENCMSSLKGSTTFLVKEAMETCAANLEMIGEVKKAIGACTMLLDDLLTFEKLDAQAMVLERTEENIVLFLEESLSVYRTLAHQADIRFEIDHSTIRSSLVFDIDKYKMRQVICNLASNALKFTPPGGLIVVQALEEEDQIEISMTDTGAGIAKENIGRVFKEIIQFNANVNQGGKGSGLGLYICRGIMDLHDGTISVQSDGLGKGSRFKLVLPRLQSRSSKEAQVVADMAKVKSDRSRRRNSMTSTSLFSSFNSLASLISGLSLRQSGRESVKASKVIPILANLEDLERGEADRGLDMYASATSPPPPRTASVTSVAEVQLVHINSQSSISSTVPSMATHLAGFLSARSATSAVTRNPSDHTPRETDISRPMVAGLTDVLRCQPYLSTDDYLEGKPFFDSRLVISFLQSCDTSRAADVQSLSIEVSSPTSDLVEQPLCSPDSASLPLSVSPPLSLSLPQSQYHFSVIETTRCQSVTEIGSVRAINSPVDRSIDGQSTPTVATSVTGTSSLQADKNWLRGFHVLAVDDSPVNLKMMCMYLRKHGATYDQAVDGLQAFSKVTEGSADIPFDFILLDYFMPVMSGAELCAKLRSAGYTLPIIGLTGHALKEDIDDFTQSGANVVLIKPLVSLEFQKAVTQLLPSKFIGGDTA